MIFLDLLLAFVLPCVGMAAVFTIYICLLWYASSRSVSENPNYYSTSEKSLPKGLSPLELQKLPCKIAGEELKDKDCAVCLDDIEIGQITRSIPGCNHGFHLQCADTWLSRNPACPLCRTKLEFPPLNPVAVAVAVAVADENLC